MQRHDACSRGKEGQGLDPNRVWGVPSLARCPPVGGCGSPPRWRRQPVKKDRGCGGEEGPGVHSGRGGGGGLWACWRARARGGGVAVCSATSATVRLTGEEGRPGLAKVGRGARGARGAGGHSQRRGPHPARRGRIPPSIIQERAVSWATWLKNEFRGHLVHPQPPAFYGCQASDSPNETRTPPFQWSVGAAGGPASPHTVGAKRGSTMTGSPGRKKEFFQSCS